MFYDLPDPAQFAKDVARCLDDEGLWTLEQSYIGTMIERNSFDYQK
jgi:NDP-4-keto-2,6-dideoxyhexose 3-C-methyltransferase